MSDHTVEELAVATFAAVLAAEHEKNGGSVRDLFAAFAALVSSRDATVGADCLTAVERFVRPGGEPGEVG